MKNICPKCKEETTFTVYFGGSGECQVTLDEDGDLSYEPENIYWNEEVLQVTCDTCGDEFSGLEDINH